MATPPPRPSVGAELAARAQKDGIKFFLVSFLDLFGVQRAKLVPASAIKDVASDGAGFAGFAAHFDMVPADPDVLAIPDPSSLIQLPWKPEVAWVASDLFVSGKPLEQSPRRVLQRQIEKAAAAGYVLKTGVEVEFMMLEPAPSDEPGPRRPRIDARDNNPKPCYDQSALMRRFDVLSEIIGYLENLGWGPYQCDHEDANAQFELNFHYADALVTADRVAFFKFMVRSVAEQHGLHATFMPKPFANKTGNGQHAHFSLWDAKDGHCVFEDKNGGGDEYGLNSLAHNFLGGLLAHIQGIAAITNPTVNSYKRLGSPSTDSGATWAPTMATHGGNDRTHLIRVPDAPHYELRLADMACNSYLLPAVILASGLEGIETKADPGPRIKVPCHQVPQGSAKSLPSNLLDALRAFEADSNLRASLGADFSKAYLNLRNKQWQEYCAHLTEWELDTYLDI